MVSIENITDDIREITANIIKENNVSDNFIDISENKNKSLSVWLCELTTNKKTKTALNIALKGKVKEKYYSFTVRKDIPKNVIPDIAEVKIEAKESSNIIVNFPVGYTEVKEFMEQVLRYSVNTFEPSDKFGCCDKYKECSDAKKCLHANQFYAKACWYRKNLEAGKIFY